jgi:hypothetical protein
MFTIVGIQPKGNQIWAVRSAWGNLLRPKLILEQQREGRALVSWVVHEVPNSYGWALLWGDAPEVSLDLRTGDTLAILGTNVGLGDVVAAVTSAFGVKPCGACKQRQEWLNKKVPKVWRSNSHPRAFKH